MTDPPALQFVDTNVLLYAYASGERGKRDVSLELVERLADERTGAVSIQVLQEFYVNATSRVAETIPTDVAAGRVRALGRWTVHAPGVSDVLGAIELHVRHRISFWDAMILRSAHQLGCAVVWSEDLNPGQDYDGVRVESPFA